MNTLSNSLKRLVGARGFEPRTSCAQGSCKKSILLVRLALFCVLVHGFGPNLAAFGPKLDLTFGVNPYSETNFWAHMQLFDPTPFLIQPRS
jgi:hypothetical protein